MEHLPNRVVDAGYLSWLYGAKPEGLNAWNLAKFDFLKDLLVLDSEKSFREEHWAEYKANRRKPQSPDMELMKERVRKFRARLDRDWMLTTVKVDGLEADDVVAVLTLHAIAEEIHVIGVDKDYLQLPPYRLKMETLGGDLATISNFRGHLPKTVRPQIKAPVDVLFTLALLGDTADNIPRLVKPYHLKDFNWVMEEEDLGKRIARATEFYGPEFARNMYLAVLPGPWVYSPVLSEEEVLERISKGTYYKQELADPIKAKVLGAYYSWYPLNEKVIDSGDIKETKDKEIA